MKLADILATLNAMGQAIHGDAESKGTDPGTRKILRGPSFAARRQLEALHNCASFQEAPEPFALIGFNAEGLDTYGIKIAEAAHEAILASAGASTPTEKDRLRAIAASMRDQAGKIGTMRTTRYGPIEQPAPAGKTPTESKTEASKTTKKGSKKA